MDKNKDNLDDKINEKNHKFNKPNLLYKYRLADRYLIQMLEEGSLYLCPADKLDDIFDCSVDFDINQISSLNQDEFFLKYFKEIEKVLVNIIPEKHCYLIDDFLKKVTDNTNKQLQFLEYIDCIETVSLEDKLILKNTLSRINSLFKKNENEECISNVLQKLINIQKQIGICSLTPIKNDYYMWDKYSHWQICIEYDLSQISQEQIDMLFQVKYVKEKSFDPLALVIEEIIKSVNDAITKTENKERIMEKLKEILITKHDEWAYQSEYRFIGKPEEYIYLPIKSVYYGLNVEENIIEKIKSIGQEKGFNVLQISKDDYKEIYERRAISAFFEKCDDYHINRFEDIQKDERPDFIVNEIGFEITRVIDCFDVNNSKEYRTFCDRVSNDVSKKVGYEVGVTFLLINPNIKYKKIINNVVDEIVQLIKGEKYEYGTNKFFSNMPWNNAEKLKKYTTLNKYFYAIYLKPWKMVYFERGIKVDDKLKTIRDRIDAKEQKFKSKVNNNILLVVADILDGTFIDLEKLKQNKHKLYLKENSKFEHIYVISITNIKKDVLKIK